MSVYASTTTGSIDPLFHNAIVCHDVTCASPAPGSINFSPLGTTPVTIDNVSGVRGVAWGNELGWINFNPSGSAGLSINPRSGAISGKAWSQVSGWVNFSPTGNGVVINSRGQFVGWAWAGGPYGGWIQFDCDVPGACVKTDWRPSITGGGGTGGGTSYPSTNPNIVPVVPNPLTDVCANLPGIQSTVPPGYVHDQGDICSLRVDYCPNIKDVQYVVPAGLVVNIAGDCVARAKKPDTKPVMYVQDSIDNSTEAVSDWCANLLGVQASIPHGYVRDSQDNCVPATTDYCPNIAGNQYDIPLGKIINVDGNCVVQSSALPKNIAPVDSSDDILAYTFIPSSIRIPSSNHIARSLVRVVAHIPIIGALVHKGTQDEVRNTKTDLVSAGVTIVVLIILLAVAFAYGRRFFL